MVNAIYILKRINFIDSEFSIKYPKLYLILTLVCIIVIIICLVILLGKLLDGMLKMFSGFLGSNPQGSGSVSRGE